MSHLIVICEALLILIRIQQDIINAHRSLCTVRVILVKILMKLEISR